MSEFLWSLDEILSLTKGTLSQTPLQADFKAIGFDSREMGEGSIFLALKGARDGHDFVASAFEKGAKLAITEHPIEGCACVVVKNVQSALEDLGQGARARAKDALRIAVTGSVGKTSVTQMLNAIFATAGHAHGAIKSFNNHIGVPLILARMPKDTRRGVFELGMNHAGEIGPLSAQVSPHSVIITTVGAVHTENFPDGEEGVMKAKAEIFEGMEKGAHVLLPCDNRWFLELKARAEEKGAKVFRFGTGEQADARLLSHQFDGVRAHVIAHINGQEVSFSLAHPAPHQAQNAVAALFMAELSGIDRMAAISALEAFGALDGRGKILNLVLKSGPLSVIDESYNANPLSMSATLKAYAHMILPDGGRKLVAMSDMLELGIDEKKLHSDLYDVLKDTDLGPVFLAGPLMKELWDILPEPLKGGYGETIDDLWPKIDKNLKAHDHLLIKGSHGSKAYRLIDLLKNAQC